MATIFETYQPPGFSTLNAYLFVSDPIAYIDFLQNALGAVEINRTLRPDSDEIANSIIQIGESCFMLSQDGGMFKDMHSAFYLFVNDVDLVYQTAIEFGAESIYPPDNMDYGDRQAGIKDPEGNYWWISMRLKETPYRD